jgi:glucoselysine-6-phosphate deglycase
LTDPKDTPVSGGADLPLRLYAEDEQIGPKTRGYMATVLTLYLMALETGLKLGSIDRGLYERKISAITDAISRGGEYLSACQAFYDANFEDMKSMKNIIFTGKGVPAKVALEDALKVLETLCYPSMGYEYEEFLHGPACCADENLGLFLFLSNDGDKERMLRTVEMIKGASKNCYIVSHDPNVRGEKILYLPSQDPVLCSPFTDILFGQLISAKLTEALGRKRHPAIKDIFTSMGTKVPVN